MYSFEEHNDKVFTQLPKGAFLTTKADGKVNSMTIGWGNVSVIWYKKVFMVYVRYSRETYNFIEKANEFTVSFPINVDMKKELAYCGTKSFREVDKIKEMGIELDEPKVINTPVIKKCDLHFECKVIYKQAIEPGLVPDFAKEKYYNGNNDYHICYYGEIVAKYGNL